MYYIDGNNLQGVVSGADVGSQAAEVQVTQLVAHWAKEQNKSVTLVFDGIRKDTAVLRSGILVVFPTPQDKNADNTIVRLLKLDVQRTNSTVITTDAELTDRAKALGAKVTRCRDWVESLHFREKPESKPHAPAKGEVGEWLEFFGVTPEVADQRLKIPPPERLKPSTKKKGR